MRQFAPPPDAEDFYRWRRQDTLASERDSVASERRSLTQRSPSAPPAVGAAQQECKAPPGEQDASDRVARTACWFTLHTIDEACTATARVSGGDLAKILALETPRTCVRWVELDPHATLGAVRVAFAGRKLHALAEELLTRPDGDAYASVERAPGGWTLWSAPLPLPRPGRRVLFAAACSRDLVITALRVEDEDVRPPSPIPAPRSRRCRWAADVADDAPAADLRRRLLDADPRDRESSADSGSPRLRFRDPHEAAPWRLSESRADDGFEALVQCVRSRLALGGDDRARIARLGGAVVCCRLVEGALDDARDAFGALDAAASRLAQVVSDDRSGWRQRRVRFNYTVRSLLDAGQHRTQISRLRDYYEQVHAAAKAACAATKDDDELAPWTRRLALLAQGDLRRLQRADALLHSYVMLARLRHEDDYNRVNVCLALIATIFLPLTFVTGVFGMNFDYLPIEHLPWAFASFCIGSFALVLVAMCGFWWRGWLNVAAVLPDDDKPHVV